MTFELGNIGIFGIGIMPGTYICAVNEFFKGLLLIPHLLMFDPGMTAYWGLVLDDPNAALEAQEEEEGWSLF